MIDLFSLSLLAIVLFGLAVCAMLISIPIIFAILSFSVAIIGYLIILGVLLNLAEIHIALMWLAVIAFLALSFWVYQKGKHKKTTAIYYFFCALPYVLFFVGIIKLIDISPMLGIVALVLSFFCAVLWYKKQQHK